MVQYYCQESEGRDNGQTINRLLQTHIMEYYLAVKKEWTTYTSYYMDES